MFLILSMRVNYFKSRNLLFKDRYKLFDYGSDQIFSMIELSDVGKRCDEIEGYSMSSKMKRGKIT